MADLQFARLTGRLRLYIESNTNVSRITLFVLPNPGRGVFLAILKSLENFFRFPEKDLLKIISSRDAHAKIFLHGTLHKASGNFPSCLHRHLGRLLCDRIVRHAR